MHGQRPSNELLHSAIGPPVMHFCYWHEMLIPTDQTEDQIEDKAFDIDRGDSSPVSVNTGTRLSRLSKKKDLHPVPERV